MNSGISAESTPKKAESSTRKRKMEIGPNETQGPEMQNPLNPIYKPAPDGDKTCNKESSSNDSDTSDHNSPKRRKVVPKKCATRKLVFKNPANEVPRLTIDRHKMKVMWKSIPETAN